MVSRRRILSRSRDDLTQAAQLEEEEDVWYQKDKLYKVSYEKKNINKNTKMRNCLLTRKMFFHISPYDPQKKKACY